jgi:hypothetical protein
VANDPAALKRRIAELERQLIARPAKIEPDENLIQKGKDLARKEAQEALTEVCASASVYIRNAVEQAMGEVRKSLGSLQKTSTIPAITYVKPSASVERTREREVERLNGKISPSARKILDAIHKAYPIALTFDAAARRAGISKSSSAYRKYQEEVEHSGEVGIECERNGNSYQSKPQFAKSEPMKPGASVEQWAAKLPPSYGRMLIAIRDGHHSRQGIANQAGVSLTSSGLSAGLKELMRLQLVTEEYGVYTLADGM